MKNEFVTVRNTTTGRVGRVRRRIAEHPVLGLALEIVPDGSKDRISLSEIVAESRPAPTFVAVEVEEDEITEEEDDE